MKLSLMLLLLLWDNVEYSLTQQNTCEVLPIHHSVRIISTSFGQGQKGPIWYFRCKNSTHVLQGSKGVRCLENGQWSHPFPTCTAPQVCGPPPPLENGNSLTSNVAFRHNERVEYQCQDNFTMQGGPYKTCNNGEWTGEIKCLIPQVCGPPPPLENGDLLTSNVEFRHNERVEYQCQDNVTMQGGPYKTCNNGEWTGEIKCLNTCDMLPVPDSVRITSSVTPRQVQKGMTLNFQCKIRRHVLQGNAQVTCLENGQWSHPFPTCRDPQGCGPPPPLENGDLLTSDVQFGHNDWAEYQCQDKFTMQGGPYKTCKYGEWTGEIKCLNTCDMLPVPDSVRITSSVTPRQVQKGTTLNFQCKIRRHVLQGNAQVTCLENGQWSHPFPTCRDNWACGPPPPLENGDLLTSNVEFGHNDWAEYQCQDKFTMQGGPYKTCYSGEWTGEIKCLRPCTVDPFIMAPHNIQFKHGRESTYISHNYRITFACTPGKRPDGRLAMRQICNDGVMNLPTCV